MPEPRDPASIADSLRIALRGTQGERVYGIVDAAIDSDLPFEAQLRFGARMQSLFLPEVAEALWDVAPYLVTVDPSSPYLEHWARRWGKSVGVLLCARAEFDTLAAHLRSVFVVKDETGQDYFFRFYDPRVLHAFLPTCTPAQMAEFFGPIRAFVCESLDAAQVVSYVVDRGTLARRADEIPATIS